MKGGIDLQKYVDVLLPCAPATIKIVQARLDFPNDYSVSCECVANKHTLFSDCMKYSDKYVGAFAECRSSAVMFTCCKYFTV